MTLVVDRGTVRRPMGLPADGLHARRPSLRPRTVASRATHRHRHHGRLAVAAYFWRPSFWCLQGGHRPHWHGQVRCQEAACRHRFCHHRRHRLRGPHRLRRDRRRHQAVGAAVRRGRGRRDPGLAAGARRVAGRRRRVCRDARSGRRAGAQGLAAAGGGLGDQVVAGQRQGQGGGLDRRHRGVAQRLQVGQRGGRQRRPGRPPTVPRCPRPWQRPRYRQSSSSRPHRHQCRPSARPGR